MPKVKLQYFGHLMRSVDSLEKTLMLGGIGGRRERRLECKLKMEISDNLKSCQVAKEGNIFTVWFLLSPWYEWVAVSSVTQSCPTIWDPMDCSQPSFPVHHQLLEFVQTHVHQVSDAIQPSYPLSPSPPVFNLFQHQGLFK